MRKLNVKNLRKKILDATIGSIRAIDYSLSSLFPTAMPEPDTTTPIDIAIPVVPKDLDILPLCVQAIRRNIPHNISAIYLIAPRHPDIIQMAEELGLIFIDEDTVLPGSPENIPIENPHRINRRGWIFQQFLKLSGKIGEAQYTIFIDADHILLRPHTFLSKEGNTILYTSKEFYLPYYDNIRRLMGHCGFARHSFIAHKMLFHKPSLSQLRNQISSRNGLPWKEAILSSLDWDYPSPFSEFELYGRFLPRRDRHCIPWRQKALSSLPAGLSTHKTTAPTENHSISSESGTHVLPDIIPSVSTKANSSSAKAEEILSSLRSLYPEALSITLPAYLRPTP